jgi:hypothetical protein
LINAGFSGKGKTIVIIDAFQNPNLIAQLKFQDNFLRSAQFERAWRRDESQLRHVHPAGAGRIDPVRTQ